jgi:hypothetical protein
MSANSTLAMITPTWLDFPLPLPAPLPASALLQPKQHPRTLQQNPLLHKVDVHPVCTAECHADFSDK